MSYKSKMHVLGSFHISTLTFASNSFTATGTVHRDKRPKQKKTWPTAHYLRTLKRASPRAWVSETLLYTNVALYSSNRRASRAIATFTRLRILPESAISDPPFFPPSGILLGWRNIDKRRFNLLRATLNRGHCRSSYTEIKIVGQTFTTRGIRCWQPSIVDGAKFNALIEYIRVAGYVKAALNVFNIIAVNF